MELKHKIQLATNILKYYYITIRHTDSLYLKLEIIRTVFSIFICCMKQPFFYAVIGVDSIVSSFNIFIYFWLRYPYYEHHWMKRYVHYSVLYIALICVHILSWGTLTQITHGLFLILVLPPVANEFLFIPSVDKFYQMIIDWLRSIDRQILTNSTAYLLNQILKQVIGVNPKISSREISYSLEDLSFVYTFVKSIVYTSVLIHIEQSGIGWLLRVSRYADKSDRETLRSAVLNRRWDVFYQPGMLKLLNDLMYEDAPYIVQKLTGRLQEAFLRFIAVNALMSIFGWPAIVISWLLLAVNPSSRKYIICRIIGTAIACTAANPLVVIFVAPAVSETSELLWNKGTRWAIREIYRNLDYIVWFSRNIEHSRGQFIAYPVICMFGNPYMLILISFICENQLLFLAYAALGLFSNYHPSHLLMISIIFYLAYNIKIGKKNKPIPLSIIQNYENNEPVVRSYERINLIENYNGFQVIL